MGTQTKWLALVGLAALLAAAWHWRGAWLTPTLLTPAAAKAAKKCLGGGRVLYTTEACPAGMREEAVQGGSLSVLAAPPAATPAAARPGASQAPPLLRQGAGPDRELQDRRMDQVIGR